MNPISHMQAGISNQDHQCVSQASAQVGNFNGGGVTHQPEGTTHSLISRQLNDKLFSKINELSVQSTDANTYIKENFDTLALDTGVVQSESHLATQKQTEMDLMTKFDNSDWEFTDLSYFNKHPNPPVSLESMTIFHLAKTVESYQKPVPFPSTISFTNIENKSTNGVLSEMKGAPESAIAEAFLSRTPEGFALNNVASMLGINIDQVTVHFESAEFEAKLLAEYERERPAWDDAPREPRGIQYSVTCSTSPNPQSYGVQ